MIEASWDYIVFKTIFFVCVIIGLPYSAIITQSDKWRPNLCRRCWLSACSAQLEPVFYKAEQSLIYQVPHTHTRTQTEITLLKYPKASHLEHRWGVKKISHCLRNNIRENVRVCL